MNQSWFEYSAQECRLVEESDSWRRPKSFDTSDANDSSGILDDGGSAGGRVVAFASNDYLGMTTHHAVVTAAHDALDRWGTGSGASRLITGSRPVHHELESELASWKGEDRAILFPTGFAANLGVLTTFGHPGAVILSDELNHASIVDGSRLAKAEVRVYRHSDVDHLGRLLKEVGGRPVIVVTDLVFSMDGDIAPIDKIARLCRHHGALLVTDEAHSVLGPDPTAVLADIAHLRVGTLSKTLGSIGGFVAGPTRFIELLENKARSYIFTTAIPPADAAAALAALRIMRGPEGTVLINRLRSHVDAIAPSHPSGGHPSPIVPIVLGSEEAALFASAQLLAAGLWVPAIRPPTVPKGTSRLRVTLSASHDSDDVERLAGELKRIRDSI
jgi:8-amino-7-oxononanoate synthase